MANLEDHPNPVPAPAEKLNKETKDGAARRGKDDRADDELAAKAQEANDAAAKAAKNAERAYKFAEEAKNRVADANNVAQNAKSIAVDGALFGAGAMIVAMFAVYGTLIN